ncbi:hypothetical protein D9M69_633260 [compost metagenome]
MSALALRREQPEDLLAEIPIQLSLAISVRVRESSALLRLSFNFAEARLLVKRAFSFGVHCCIGCVVVQPATNTAVAISAAQEDTRKKFL